MDECRNAEIPCAVSTTTHIQKCDAGYFLGKPSVEMFRQIMIKYGVVWMGRETTDGKLASFQEEYLKEISREPGVLLLEADGAKRLPVKTPAEHEPVICEQTDIVLNVYGMSAVGKKLKEGCFRGERDREDSRKDRRRYSVSGRYCHTCGKSECGTKIRDG